MIRDLLFCAGGTGWSPLSLFASGEKGFWYDASDLTTLFQDSGGTTPVTTTAQPVGLWLDKSGNSNDIIQSTAAKRPLFVDTSGKYTINFDGVDDYLEKASVSVGTTNSITMCLGFTTSSPNTITILELNKNKLGISGSYGRYSQSITYIVTSNTVNSSTPNVLLGYSDTVSTHVTAVLNGTTSTGSLPTVGLSDGQLIVGKDSYVSVQLSQVIVVLRQLTATEKTQVVDYITGKQ